MLLSAVSVLVVAQSSSEIPEGLMNNPALSNEYNDWRVINWKGYGKRPSWSSLIYMVFILSFSVSTADVMGAL